MISLEKIKEFRYSVARPLGDSHYFHDVHAEWSTIIPTYRADCIDTRDT